MKLAGVATLPLDGIMAGSIPAAGSPTRLFHCVAAAAPPWMNGCHFPSIYLRFYDYFQFAFYFVFFSIFKSMADDLLYIYEAVISLISLYCYHCLLLLICVAI